MKNYHFFKFQSSILSNDKLKLIKGGLEEVGCSATAKCNNNKTVSCTGATSCSGTDYDRVVCDGVATNCPECD